jgi:hypothetical protein
MIARYGRAVYLITTNLWKSDYLRSCQIFTHTLNCQKFTHTFVSYLWKSDNLKELSDFRMKMVECMWISDNFKELSEIHTHHFLSTITNNKQTFSPLIDNNKQQNNFLPPTTTDKQQYTYLIIKTFYLLHRIVRRCF